MRKVLVIDDDTLMREFMAEALQREGYAVETAANGSEGVQKWQGGSYDVVITDLRMGTMSGTDLVRRIREEDPHIPIFIMTAYGTIESAIEALKAGATDYWLKPLRIEAVSVALQRALAQRRLAEENQYLRGQINAAYDFDTMVGKTPAMQHVYETIRRVADTRATVLLRGESGTGKELVARAIHHQSVRRNNPFIKVNCAALSAGILESELFGHERGAFTGAVERKIGRFELAHTGTLMLDEISEIPPTLQAKLLRALQEREFERVGGTDTIQVDVRLIATTNRNLEEAVAQGHFREDLFYRLHVVTITLPPLRERKEDIPALVDLFVRRYATEYGRRIEGIRDSARRRLLEYDWPGNVRELQNAVERAVILATDGWLDVQHFQIGATAPTRPDVEFPAGVRLADMERTLILRTLQHCQYNRTKAAELLGISVRTLRNKLREYREAGIEVPGA